MKPRTRMLVSMIVAMSFFSCAGKRPDHLGVDGARLAPCPRSPNCVSSDAEPGDAQHGIEPLALASEPAEAWQTVRDVVARMPRTKIQTESDGYLHAECSSALMGYVDDLELHLRASDGLIAVRSASRVGYGDMGVNRKRVETLRARLAERGAVR